MTEHTCKLDGCGQVLPADAWRTRKYCSNVCAAEARRLSGIAYRERVGGQGRRPAHGAGSTKVCAEDACANAFVSRGGAHRYCTDCFIRRDATASLSRKYAAREKRNAERLCRVCGGTIPGLINSKRIQCDACIASGDAARDTSLRHLYGLSLRAFTDMASQGCAICGAVEGYGSRPLSVDHDHSCCPGDRTCGKCVRALLCGACNTAIGHMRDDPARLRAAADYLDTHNSRLVSLAG